MASPIFQRFIKRFVVQVRRSELGAWQDEAAFGSYSAAEAYVRQTLRANPRLQAGRVVDRVTGQAGAVIEAPAG
ncbi:MAG: hypothetical protein KDI62_04525 [Anaerolineae bacterium]|nr:hypothetical protein [Anaerolineae bacterium]MCB0177471.1 hypothetical protein [Anaerolineae bacterium]MCB9103057.1 hypothetical protein [Anaerolineales bacterium]